MSTFRCLSLDFQQYRAKDDDIPTLSSTEQAHVEDSINRCYTIFKESQEFEPDGPVLRRELHRSFLLKGIEHLSESYEALDASRPWLCYWILHSMELLEVSITDDIATSVVDFLSRCQLPDGGYGGGPGQVAHLAPTYAAVCALCIIGTEQAYKSINRESLAAFLMRIKNPDGSYRMHEGGEVDIRGAYCAAVVARLTEIATPDMFDGTPEWIVRCQTYEGGFAGGPGMEAHGGYSFCGLAALVLLGKQRLCDLRALLRWTAARQMSFEGGFQGRTNKLVDGCYSFWQGGAFPLIHSILAHEGDKALSTERWMFNQDALQEYVLMCCQHPGGGLIDKPGKARDFYHTCYCLSGLSIAQHFAEGKLSTTHIIGNKTLNELMPTHPLFNVGVEAVRNAHLYFDTLKQHEHSKDEDSAASDAGADSDVGEKAAENSSSVDSDIKPSA